MTTQYKNTHVYGPDHYLDSRDQSILNQEIKILSTYLNSIENSEHYRHLYVFYKGKDWRESRAKLLQIRALQNIGRNVWGVSKKEGIRDPRTTNRLAFVNGYTWKRGV